MAKLDHRHHAFIQALMTRGPLSEAAAKAMFRALFREENGDFAQFVTMINKEMNFVQMELRAGRNQYDGVLYYGLVNKVGNEQAKLGTRFAHAQIAFFKAVVEAIISESSSTGKISAIQALNLRLDVQNEQQPNGELATQTSVVSSNLNLAQKEKTLSDLVQDQWLSNPEHGTVALGVRSFLELWSVFKNYDVPFCDVCNEAGIRAQSCQNEDCPVRMHEYCLEIKFRRAQVPRVCPKCATDWGSGGIRVSQVQESLNGEQELPQQWTPTVSPELKRPRTSRRARSVVAFNSF